jgi:hypothetical protein
MKFLFGPLTALGLLAITSSAHAEPRLELGARLGYAVPFGRAVGSNDIKLREHVSGQVPIWVDLGARVTQHLVLGGFVSAGLAVPGNRCDEIQVYVDDCSMSAYDLRLGIQAQVHLMPTSHRADPWLGIGFGYEWLHEAFDLAADGERADVSMTIKGFELANLQAGVDFLLNEHVAAGPFVAFTLARYEHGRLECSGDCEGVANQSTDLGDKALHHWLFAGARVVILP